MYKTKGVIVYHGEEVVAVCNSEDQAYKVAVLGNTALKYADYKGALAVLRANISHALTEAENHEMLQGAARFVDRVLSGPLHKQDGEEDA